MSDSGTYAAPPRIGSYSLLNPLGSGGMGTVFRGVHLESGHEVAIKILPRSLAKNPVLLQRFLGEAKAAEALIDPHIVEILDRGADGGRHYIVMEYVRGGDLHERVQRLGPLPVPEAVEAIRSTALALRHAVTKGLIHRDIKPANLMMGSDGRIKLTDLGLALQTGEESERVTRDGTTVGTVDYMSPEQARDSRAITLQSDMYSLGCTFYYLLAGAPPFGGAGLTEKLRRHVQVPPPDIREARPEVSEALAALIKRMMAKRPERRFVDYDHLLRALDELDLGPGDAPDGLEPEYATMVPEADGLPVWKPATDDVGLVPLPEETDSRGSGGFRIGPGPAGSGTSPGSTQLHQRTRSGSGLPTLPGTERPPALVPPTSDPSLPVPREQGSVRQRPVPAGVESIDLIAAGPTPAPPPSIPPPPDRTLLVLLLRGALAGLILVFLGIGVVHLMGLVSTDRQTTVVDRDGESDPGGGNPGVLPIRGNGAREATPVETAWVEPAEPSIARAEPPAFPAPSLEGLGLASVIEPDPAFAGPPPTTGAVVVRRVGILRDREHVESLQRAFDALSGSILLDGDGPFYEGGFRGRDRDRVLRAARGRRPIIVPRPSPPSTRSSEALLVLDGSKLAIEGIDLVVRAEDLPPGASAIFHLRGGASLSLRDCTITVVGGGNNPNGLALALVGDALDSSPDPQASKVRFEGCLIRGTAVSAIRVAGGDVDVEVFRSALISGASPTFLTSGRPDRRRSIRLVGSLVAGEAGFLDLRGSATAADAPAIEVRAFGSVFARVESEAVPALVGLVTIHDPIGGGVGASAVDWRGDENRFLGFAAMSESDAPSGRAAVAIAGLDALRALRADAEPSSRSDPNAPSLGADPSWVERGDLEASIPDLGALLAATAAPTPNLPAWSIGAFEPLPTAPFSAKTVSTDAGTFGFNFDANAEGGDDDLGRILKSRPLPPGTRRVVVHAKGIGWHPLTPIRLPAGIDLTIAVDPPASGDPEDRLVWRPAEGAAGAALIDVQGADLVLSGVAIERDALSGLKSAVRVSQGRLAMEDCSLRAPGSVPPGGGNLVEFRTEGSRPLDDGADPADGNAPICQLLRCTFITGGDAITAAIGRGVVGLDGCRVAAGGSAFVLSPLKVARDRFGADLRLERCTIASERDFVRLEKWPGAESGPERPWVVNSRQSAWIDRYDRAGGQSTSVLWRVEAETATQGVLIWQSESDYYEVKHDVEALGVALAASTVRDPARRLVEFWGPSHVLTPVEAGSYRFRDDKLKPGEVEPQDLDLVAERQGVPQLGAERVGTEP